jgi:hypothetical protein
MLASFLISDFGLKIRVSLVQFRPWAPTIKLEISDDKLNRSQRPRLVPSAPLISADGVVIARFV